MKKLHSLAMSGMILGSLFLGNQVGVRAQERVMEEAPAPFIRVTTMGFCAADGKNYLRLRNDGSVRVDNAAWRHVNSSTIGEVGPLDPGQLVIFTGVNGQYDGGYMQEGGFVRTHGRSSTNTTPFCPSTPTPQPTPAAERTSRIEITGITCSNTNFDAKYYALENDNPVAGVKVTFEYRNIKKDAVTDANGMAVAGYSFMGVDTVFARPDGFPDQNARIDDATGCAASTTSEAPGVGGQVLGIITEQAASTHAPVLGVSTLAATGTTDDVIARTTGILGGALIMIGSYLYAKKKVSA